MQQSRPYTLWGVAPWVDAEGAVKPSHPRIVHRAAVGPPGGACIEPPPPHIKYESHELTLGVFREWTTSTMGCIDCYRFVEGRRVESIIQCHAHRVQRECAVDSLVKGTVVAFTIYYMGDHPLAQDVRHGSAAEKIRHAAETVSAAASRGTLRATVQAGITLLEPMVLKPSHGGAPAGQQRLKNGTFAGWNSPTHPYGRITYRDATDQSVSIACHVNQILCVREDLTFDTKVLFQIKVCLNGSLAADRVRPLIDAVLPLRARIVDAPSSTTYAAPVYPSTPISVAPPVAVSVIPLLTPDHRFCFGCGRKCKITLATFCGKCGTKLPVDGSDDEE